MEIVFKYLKNNLNWRWKWKRNFEIKLEFIVRVLSWYYIKRKINISEKKLSLSKYYYILDQNYVVCLLENKVSSNCIKKNLILYYIWYNESNPISYWII